jgi:signal transduction histidine kinase
MARRILVAEDSPTQAEHLRLLLEAEGYDVDVVGNGREGLRRIEAAPPDLIISDVVMPEMDGYGFCQAVKSAEATKRIPFVLLTAQHAPGDIIKGLERGADNFIPKPFEEDQLLERIRRIFEHLELRKWGPLDMEVTLRVGGRVLRLNADKQQIIEFLFATFDELGRLNGRLEEHARNLEAKVQETERLNLQLRHASEVKSQFLASMSHELRTPLNAIIGFTELLLASARDPLAERQRSALEKVRAAGQHLLALINDVLDLSKIEAGRLDIRPGPVALAALVREGLAAVEPQAQAKGLALRAAGLEHAPDMVQDGGRITQILVNLLSNAVKFTPAGSVEVRVEPARDGMVAITVADTGIGIPAEHLEAIFDPFEQVDSPETRAAGGTGLGLAISRRLARLMGGTLTVESVPGRGSVFTLRLPVRAALQDGAGEAEPEAMLPLPPGTARLLVIDDDRDTVELVRDAVAGEPIRVEWAASPSAALTRVRARRPTVILLDVMLQGEQDGWDLLDALKTGPGTRDIPVVVYSVVDNPRRAEQLGADGALVKPANPASLRALLSRLLAGQPAGARETDRGPA